MNISELNDHRFNKLEELNGTKVIIKTKNEYKKIKKHNTCVDCKTEKIAVATTGSFQCESCRELMLVRFRKQQKGVDIYE